MNPVIDITKEYGIVLEGGGARGSYQIGAWKALREAGVKIKGVAGTSVGALNGALLCMGDIAMAEEIWNNITYSSVMNVKDELMERLFQGEIKIKETLRTFFQMVGEGGADVTPLKQLIQEKVDEDIIRNSGIEFYLLTFSISEMKELDLSIDDIEEGLLADFLLASAYMFIFRHEKLHGKKYTDGAFINNYPLGSLVDRDYKDIIAIRIFGPGRERKVKIDEDTTVYTIEPRVKLGNVVDFSTRKSKRNMKIGYYDAKRLIYGLKGFIYYIEQFEEECYYLKKLLDTDDAVKRQMCSEYGQEPEEKQLSRIFLEIVCPAVAAELKLGRNWTYEELYIAMTEATAKLLRIQKYKVYKLDELIELTQKKALLRPEVELPVFAYIILNKIKDE